MPSDSVQEVIINKTKRAQGCFSQQLGGQSSSVKFTLPSLYYRIGNEYNINIEVNNKECDYEINSLSIELWQYVVSSKFSFTKMVTSSV